MSHEKLISILVELLNNNVGQRLTVELASGIAMHFNQHLLQSQPVEPTETP